jgi:hypothetical protein
LLAQKVTKKGTLPNASTLKLTRSSLGKEACPLFFFNQCFVLKIN